MDNDSNVKLNFTLSDLASYIVCPEAWRLRRVEDRNDLERVVNPAAASFRQTWADEQNLSSILKKYAQIIFFLLVLIMLVVVYLDTIRVTTRNGVTPSEKNGTHSSSIEN